MSLTLEEVQALDVGATVTILHGNGTREEWTTGSEGLLRNGATVPWRLFAGIARAGMIHTDIDPVPTAGRWYQTGSYRFFVHRVHEDTMWYTTLQTGPRGSVSRAIRSRLIGDWVSGGNRVELTSVEVQSLNQQFPTQVITQLANAVYTVDQSLTEALEKIDVQERAERIKARLETLAPTISNADLDQLLASVGWGRPREIDVRLRLQGTLRIDSQRMTEAFGSDFTFAGVNVSWSRDVVVQRAISEGTQCLCNQGELFREEATQYVPEGSGRWLITSTCTNH